MTRQPFAKVGDKVTVFGGFSHTAERVQKVAKLSARYIVLDDGTQWDFCGVPKGRARERFYTGPLLHTWQPEHDEVVRRKHLLTSILQIEWPRVPTEVLATVLGILKEEKTDGNPPA